MNGMYRRAAYALVGVMTAALVVGAAASDVIASGGTADAAVSTRQVKMAPDAVKAHIEVIEWKLTADEYVAVSEDQGADLSSMASEEGAKTRLMYVFDSILKTGEKARMISGTKVPIVRSHTNRDGQVSTAVEYKDVGCRIDMYCDWAEAGNRGRVHAQLNIDVSDLITETPVALHGGSSAPLFTSCEHRCETAAALGEQRSFISLSTQRLGQEEQQHAIAYLFHVRFDAVPAE